MRKVVFVIAVLFLSSLAIGRAESLLAHRGFAGSAAYAQNWDNSGSDASSTAEPETKSPPNVAGTYSGTIDDHQDGSGPMTMTINQNGKKLTGNFTTFFNSGTIKGSVSTTGKVHARLKVGGTCGASFHGTFENGDEIVGVYNVSGCRPKDNGDHGTIDATD